MTRINARPCDLFHGTARRLPGGGEEMKRVFVLPLIFAACAALLWGVLFHFEFVYAYVIDPIVRIFWFATKLFLMIDQEVYWVLLIFLSLGLLLWIVPKGQEELGLTQKYADNTGGQRPGTLVSMLYEQACGDHPMLG